MYVAGNDYFAVITFDCGRVEKKYVKCEKVLNKYAYFDGHLRTGKYSKHGQRSKDFHECVIYRDEASYFEEVEQKKMAKKIHERISSDRFAKAMERMTEQQLKELGQLAAKYGV